MDTETIYVERLVQRWFSRNRHVGGSIGVLTGRDGNGITRLTRRRAPFECCCAGGFTEPPCSPSLSQTSASHAASYSTFFPPMFL